MDPRQAPDSHYLVERILPARGANLLLGPPKRGKSQLAAHFVASALAGQRVLDRYSFQDGANELQILWITAEETRFKPRARVEANLRGFGWTEDEVHEFDPGERLIVCARDPSHTVSAADSVFKLERHHGWLREIAPDYDLVILDPLRAVHSRDENSSQAMKAVTDLMRELACQTCFLVVHHTGHENLLSARKGPDRARGTTDLDAARDTAIVFESGCFGGSVHLGVYHRDDAEVHIGIVTSASREAGTASWAAVADGNEQEVKQALTQTAFLPRIQKATTLDDLPTATEAKKWFGSGYKSVVKRLAASGLLVPARYKPPGRGAPRKVLMLPGQFDGVEVIGAEEL